jgi:hypothetical protein
VSGKTLLNAIRDDYATESAAEFTHVVDAFCSFADKWLRKKGVVGLGQTTEGFAIRFADGSELLLAINTEETEADSNAFSITGLASRRQNVMPDTTRSVNITGR